jgi:hypothetical protein
MKEKGSGASLVSCGCLLIFNLLLGGISVNYLLDVFLGKTIPFIGAALIGLVAGEFTVPVAFVVWILKSFGVM